MKKVFLFTQNNQLINNVMYLFWLVLYFIFVPMYNRKNYLKTVGHIISVYNLYKSYDVPDTYIVKNYFPKHFIFLSYRCWMNIKGTTVPNKNILNENKLLTEYGNILELFKPKEVQEIKMEFDIKENN